MSRIRAVGLVLIVVASISCAGTFIYGTHISSPKSRRNAFLIGMGVSCVALSAGVRWFAPGNEEARGA